MDLFTWTSDLGIPHTVKCDVVVSWKDEQSTEPTQHPVESGVNISDHVKRNPRYLSVQLVQSNEPIESGTIESALEGFVKRPVVLPVVESRFRPQGLLAIHSAIGGLLSRAKPIAKAYVITSSKGKDRIGELHDALSQALHEAVLCAFTFKGRVYTDYLITRVVLTYDRTNPPVFDLEVMQIKTVETGIATLPNPADFAVKPPVVRGPVTKATPSEGEAEAVSPSLLAQIRAGVIGAIAEGIE